MISTTEKTSLTSLTLLQISIPHLLRISIHSGRKWPKKGLFKLSDKISIKFYYYDPLYNLLSFLGQREASWPLRRVRKTTLTPFDWKNHDFLDFSIIFDKFPKMKWQKRDPPLKIFQFRCIIKMRLNTVAKVSYKLRRHDKLIYLCIFRCFLPHLSQKNPFFGHSLNRPLFRPLCRWS